MNIGQQNALVPYPCRVEELSGSDSEDNENPVQGDAVAIISNPVNGGNPVQHSVMIAVGEKFNSVLDLGVDGVASVFTSICRGVSFISLSLLGSRTAESGEQKVKNALNSFFNNRIVRIVMKVALVLTAAYLLLKLCFPAVAEKITGFIGAVLTSIAHIFDSKPEKPDNPNGPTSEKKSKGPNVFFFNRKKDTADKGDNNKTNGDKKVCDERNLGDCI